MEAGRELDALVAERVMGWSVYMADTGGIAREPLRREAAHPGDDRRVPEFSTDRTACAEAEAEIVRRELLGIYIAHLIVELKLSVVSIAGAFAGFEGRRDVAYTTGPEEIARLVTASPEARVRAMLATVSHHASQSSTESV